MQLDRKAMQKILSMNDSQLSRLIGQVAAEAGVDLQDLGMTSRDMENIRTVLENATDSDLEKFNQIYDDYRRNRRSK